MIKVTRINKVDSFWINEDQIEIMEETPDTIISMVSGRKYAVAETAAEIAEKIIMVKRAVLNTRNGDGDTAG